MLTLRIIQFSHANNKLVPASRPILAKIPNTTSTINQHRMITYTYLFTRDTTNQCFN
jgi:hypothetical protein